MTERFKTLCLDRDASAARIAAENLDLRRTDGLATGGRGRTAPSREVFVPRQGAGYMLTLEAGPPPRCFLGVYRLSTGAAEAALDALALRLREQGLRTLPGERRVQPDGQLLDGIGVEGPGPRRRVMAVGPQSNPGSALTVVFQTVELTDPRPPRVEPIR
ncbi:MAG: hypothetical protein K2X11_20085 [Acetobacteraceae bacterium]|nr:hypothetical protein [Acetobacteraceae bacterium]